MRFSEDTNSSSSGAREKLLRILRLEGIDNERVLSALERVPREQFVPQKLHRFAYDNRPLPVGLGQTISQPYIVACMTSLLGLEGGEKTLEVGTGSGYQTALLCELGARVYTIEQHVELQETAMSALKKLGYDTVRFRAGDGTRGWKEEAPFDRVIVTAGALDVPPPLARQLAEGGRMVIPVGRAYSQTLTLCTKKGEKLEKEEMIPCVFVPLVGEYGW